MTGRGTDPPARRERSPDRSANTDAGHRRRDEGIPPYAEMRTSSAPVCALGHLPRARGRLSATTNGRPCEIRTHSGALLLPEERFLVDRRTAA